MICIPEGSVSNLDQHNIYFNILFRSVRKVSQSNN